MSYEIGLPAKTPNLWDRRAVLAEYDRITEGDYDVRLIPRYELLGLQLDRFEEIRLTIGNLNHRTGGRLKVCVHADYDDPAIIGRVRVNYAHSGFCLGEFDAISTPWESIVAALNLQLLSLHFALEDAVLDAA